jgi:uncharacterized protein
MTKNVLQTTSNHLSNYIEERVLTLYDDLDFAHNKQHVLNVMERSAVMGKLLNRDNDILLTGAAYHDLGILFDRSNHEKISAKIFQQDSFMKEWFSPADVKLISESIEDHRSTNSQRPRSIYGEILHDIDTFGGDFTELMIRSIGYGKKYFGRYTKKQHFERIRDYLKRKYGDFGYATLYIDYLPHRNNFSEINNSLKLEDHMQKLFDTLFVE